MQPTYSYHPVSENQRAVYTLHPDMLEGCAARVREWDGEQDELVIHRVAGDVATVLYNGAETLMTMSTGALLSSVVAVWEEPFGFPYCPKGTLHNA